MSTNDLRAEVFGNSSDESDWDDEGATSPRKPSPKKRKAPSKSSGATKKRKEGPADNGSQNDDDDEEEDSYEPPSHRTQFELQMEEFKNKEKTYRRQMHDTEVTADADVKVEGFIKRMDDAMHADREAKKGGKPAFAVLNMLDTTFRTLSKRQLQESFVSQGVLTVLANWLMPYEDGSNPHSAVRELVLKVCNQFAIDKDQLKDSGLGQIVAKIKKDKKEVKVNRRLAQELINKWCRQIFPTATTDYTEYPIEERTEDAMERERLHSTRMARREEEATERTKGGTANALGGAIAGSSQTVRTKSKSKSREAMLSKRARVPQANLNTYSRPPPAEEGVERRLQQMPSNMSAGDRKIKSVREARGKASKSRVVGMKIVGL